MIKMNVKLVFLLATIFAVFEEGAGGTSEVVPLNLLKKYPKAPLKSSVPATTNSNKVDDIFYLLADIDPSSITSDDSYGSPNTEENRIHESVLDSVRRKIEPSTLRTYLKMFNSLSKVAFKDSKPVEDVMNTVRKVTKIYEDQKQKRTNHFRSPDDIEPYTENMLQSTSRVIKHLMEPPNIERVFEIGMKANREDEILEELTSIILGAEERDGGHYGSSLTLDPVTCIALVALAAYLIRAVFQIVTALNMNRSFSSSSDFPLTFAMSDLPAIMVNLHNMISASEVNYERFKREIDHQPNKFTTNDPLLDLSTEIALFMKMTLDNHQSCIKNFICHNLAGKSITDFGAPEVFWSLIGLYKGQYGVSRYISETLPNKEEVCQSFSAECEEEPMDDTECLPCYQDTMEEYLQMQFSISRLLKMLAIPSNSWMSLLLPAIV